MQERYGKESFMYRVLKPRYWQLAILCAIGIGLLVLFQILTVSETVRTSADFGIVWCGYGVFNLWLAVNGGAIERQKEALEDATNGKSPAVSWQQTHYRRAIQRRVQHDE
jgi:hypothetical protein